MNDSEASPAPAPTPVKGSDFDVAAFRAQHRIHVKDGSLFFPDNYLMVHPNEVQPEHSAALTAKLLRQMTLPQPSFFAIPGKAQAAEALASFLPVSRQLREETLQKELEKIQEEAKTGVDPANARRSSRQASPFASLIRFHLEEEPMNQVVQERLKQAMELYLVVSEGLRAAHLDPQPEAHLSRSQTPEYMMNEIARKLKLDKNQLIDVAGEKGVDGVAQLLGIKPERLQEIKQLSAMAAGQQFADNLIQSWQTSIAAEPESTAPLQQKLLAGTVFRVALKKQELEQKLGGHSLPAYAKELEERVEAALRHSVPNELSELLYCSGTELAFTPAPRLDGFDARVPGALGFHHFVPFDHGKPYGMRQIYVAGRSNDRELDEVVTHECHHALFPQRFSADDRQAIDGLISQSMTRLSDPESGRGLYQLTQAWKNADTPAARAAIEAEITDRFDQPGLGLKQALKSGDMLTLVHDVSDIYQNLNPDSEILMRYPTPESRVAELISRFAELKYCRMRECPELLQYIAPEMSEIYDHYFMPHIKAQLAEVKAEQQQIPEAVRYLGFPPEEQLVQVVGNLPQLMQSSQLIPSFKVQATSIQRSDAVQFEEAYLAAARGAERQGRFAAMLDDGAGYLSR